MKVLFLSVLYMPGKMSSDKQFVRELIGTLPEKISSIVWTLNDWPCFSLNDHVGEKDISVRTGCRSFHRPRYNEDEIKKGNWSYSPHPRHVPSRQMGELWLSFFLNFVNLRSVVKQEKPDIIHLTDNWGPVAWALKAFCGNIPITVAKPSVGVGGGAGSVYGKLIRASLLGVDTVVPFTNACALRLSEVGVNIPMTTIPWGISLPEIQECSNVQLKDIRDRYGCSEKELLVVASLQSDAEDLRTINDLRYISKNLPLKAVVAVKPDHWKDVYDDLSGENIIFERGPEDYQNLLWAADLIFSPTYNRFQKRTATPPLTWMEAMARKTVLITTPGYGVEELICNGKNGLLFNSQSELLVLTKSLFDGSILKQLKNAAMQSIHRKYSIRNISLAYSNLWESFVQRAKAK